MVTAQQLREMGSVNEIIDLLEKAVGHQLPCAISISLALSHGAARAGGTVLVIDTEPGGGGVYDETPNYEEIANILNGSELAQANVSPCSIES